MLLDTSGLFCFHHKNEAGHDDARAFIEASGQKFTHSYVLSEFVALAHARKLPRLSALAFVIAILSHPEIEIIWVDEPLHRKAISLLEARLDKSYSLCDAVSFVIMKERGIIDALTTDHHFEQEGFRRLP